MSYAKLIKIDCVIVVMFKRKQIQKKPLRAEMGEGVTGLNRMEALASLPRIAHMFLRPRTYVEILRKKK